MVVGIEVAEWNRQRAITTLHSRPRILLEGTMMTGWFLRDQTRPTRGSVSSLLLLLLRFYRK